MAPPARIKLALLPVLIVPLAVTTTAFAAPAPVITASMLGTWEGVSHQHAPLPKTQNRIKVAFAKTASGRFVGAIHFPYLPCHGTLTLLRQEADRYIWRENTRPGGHCIDRSIITFKVTPTGDLSFKEYEPTTGAQDA